MCRAKGARSGIAKPSSREISPKWANNMGKERVLRWSWEERVGEAAAVLSLSPHRAPAASTAPQSLIALGEPRGKEWEGEAETDAKD